MNRPLFKSRICDGIEDCPNGVDEKILGNCDTGTLNEKLLQPFSIDLVYKTNSTLNQKRPKTVLSSTIGFTIAMYLLSFLLLA